MPTTIEDLLTRSRTELLDLSTRNRLISIPVFSKSARLIQVRDEISNEVYRMLVAEGRTFGFLPGRSPAGPSDPRPAASTVGADMTAEAAPPGPLPFESGPPTADLERRHRDSRLQTALTPEGLERRLLEFYRDARTMLEEQGVNILYLVLGHLEWYETAESDSPRHAPLILLPVELGRKAASERFTLHWTQDEIEENLSLRAKLSKDFGIEMPPFVADEEFNPDTYFDLVRRAVSAAPRWKLLPNAITLGFFSFAKFLMYRDLTPENWPAAKSLVAHPFIRSLLQDGFVHAAAPFPEETHLDELIPASRLDHVVDADGSQSLAIEAVRQGRSLVIQGPPGTGKSQSITNIISTAVLDGKRVLFVAEKLAALEVVKRRLEHEGLGPLCLELHSNKANKRAVIEEIGRTWRLAPPKIASRENLIAQLETARTALNRHVESLHQNYPPSGLTPFETIGRLIALEQRGQDGSVVPFDGATEWTPEQRRERRSMTEDIAERVRRIGLPSAHPWRGVSRENILPIDVDPLLKQIQSVAARIAEVQDAAGTLAAQMSHPIPATLGEIERLATRARFVVAAPPLDRTAIAKPAWNIARTELRQAIAAGCQFSAARAQHDGRVAESIWEKDFAADQAALEAHGKSFFRIFHRAYRSAMAAVRAALTQPMPGGHADRVALVGALVSGQRSFRLLREGDALGQAAFGSVWKQANTNWAQATAILDWVEQQESAGLGPEFREFFAGLRDTSAIPPMGAELERRQEAARRETTQLFEVLALDGAVAFAEPDPAQVPLATLAERCGAWLGSAEKLPGWNLYSTRARVARQAGLASLVSLLESGDVPADSARDCFDRIYYSELFREFARQYPPLAAFDGEVHNRLVAEFRQLDKARLTLAKYRVLAAHCERMPPRNAGVGAAGIVKAEMERKRGHRPVRRLLKDAGSVVQAVKPVFMMSPLSVAQFLEPGAVEFDLLVIDEASQVQPVDALGAVARAQQIVVVGDSKQLPPTRFFSRLTSGDETAEEDDDTPAAAHAQDVESILGLCRARGLPERMLRWHYRSRHHSLIAVSNLTFYENKLFIVPSPFDTTESLGLKFRYTADGVFDRGATGTNPNEASAICEAVIRHARTQPELSLGVAAFSIKQQQAILDQLELLRREHPETEEFFAPGGPEPFFVKNLENVQGDERDVIFISVGYGRDAHGMMTMNFGPLNNEGGERRLNVLISRAKRRCEVFSSITADDIDLERAPGVGVTAFKRFLSFAQTGRLDIAESSGRNEDSPFEVAVRNGVESLGYEVRPQVGIAGFFIDLGVVSPAQPGSYLLGIECDGAAYHSSRSARDRDRLRQSVLEAHGWILHRIWSTDWFRRPAEELRKVAAAIEKARTQVRDEPPAPPAPQTNAVVADAARLPSQIERETETDAGEVENGLSALSQPYREATLAVSKDDDPGAMETEELAEVVRAIVEIEGPVHEEEVLNRIRDLWEYRRAGSRLQEAVNRAIGSAVRTGRCALDTGFLCIPNAPIPIRNREETRSANLRKPEMLPPCEVQAAILAVVDAAHGAAREEIPTAVARTLGFKTTGPQLRAVIEAQLDHLTQQRRLVQGNGMLTRQPGPAPGP